MPPVPNRGRRVALAFLRDGQDRKLAANAAGYRCDVFLTCDKEMSSDKKVLLESNLAGTRILEPTELLTELRAQAPTIANEPPTAV